VASGFAALIAILLATIALLPSWLGVVVTRTLGAANYEIHQKSDAPSPAASAPGLVSASPPASARVAFKPAQAPSPAAAVSKANTKPELKQ